MTGRLRSPAGRDPRGGPGGPADGSAPRDRTRARAWILQILYRWDSERKGGGAPALAALMDETFATRLVALRRQAYIRRVLDTLEANFPEVDQALRDSLENWRLERLSVMDRAILRLAATEILYLEDIPPRVSIQEAIRLAEQYGGDESGRFVNGVLDALFGGGKEARGSRPVGDSPR
jgi:transcription antitermination protein NusB